MLLNCFVCAGILAVYLLFWGISAISLRIEVVARIQVFGQDPRKSFMASSCRSICCCKCMCLSVLSYRATGNADLLPSVCWYKRIPWARPRSLGTRKLQARIFEAVPLHAEIRLLRVQ
jgi:hypothetical protein